MESDTSLFKIDTAGARTLKECTYCSLSPIVALSLFALAKNVRKVSFMGRGLTGDF